MADYGCFPLWYNDSDKVGNIYPCNLPLTKQTIDRLEKWEATFDSFLDWSDPGNSPEVPDDVWEAFKQKGKELLELVQSELGSKYEVTLHDH